VGSGVGSVYSGTAPVEIGTAEGSIAFAETRVFHGRVHAFELRNGIDGPAVADPGIVDQDEGVTSWTGADGLPWTATGSVRLLRAARAHGEVTSWPPRWHHSGGDRHVPITAAGILRRLRQGDAPIQSPLRRSLAESPGLVAYWPMEDDEGATQAASALPAGKPFAPRSAGAEFAGDAPFLGAAACPVMKTGQFTGQVEAYTVTAQTSFHFLCYIPDGTLSAARLLGQLVTTGTARTWDVWYASTGDFGLSVYDRNGDQIFTQPIAAIDIVGRVLRVRLDLTQVGANIQWRLYTVDQAEWFGNFMDGTINGRTVGAVRRVQAGDPNGLGDTVLGHVMVANQITDIFDVMDQFQGFGGENGGARLVRLGAENSVPIQIIGQIADMPAMGVQQVSTLLALLEDVADTDGGILADARDELGLVYRTRASMYNQPVRLPLDYTAPGLAPGLEPEPDDQQSRNDITVKRHLGTSARAVLETGPLSVLPPPYGVGRYEDTPSVNIEHDEGLPDHATWRLHLGTWDEARFPSIGAWLHRAPDLIPAAHTLDVGDRIVVEGVPAWVQPEPVDEHAQGYTEVLRPTQWTLTFNATPAGPWQVGVVEADRYDTAGAELAAAVDADDTTLSVATLLGPIWTTNPAHAPFDIRLGGERITVTAITGETSVQTFTVTRAVNGVTKPHAAGAPLSLWKRPVYAL
jgi:hypothetical protein